ncbi:MAG: DUF4276 family protein [Magnetococcales bacterium]|nr:DUF4276 family protein [Magnetococcales bacterium]MBF0419341.1 DUF4276 family protein [Magnetococcales bacterium]
MVRVVVFAEGQTEEQFIKRVVAPSLMPSMVSLEPQLLKTSQQAKGGAIHFDRLRFHARNTLRTSSAPILSTFLDLYALDANFPAFADARKQTNIYSRVSQLEDALHQAIVREAGCRPERFIPHIQPYEFEGLLFSDIDALCTLEKDWHSFQGKLNSIRNSCDNPEHINDSYETKPSKRLEDTLTPKYRKTRHGPLAAERITLEVIEKNCPHFRGWMEKLRKLSPHWPQ